MSDKLATTKPETFSLAPRSLSEALEFAKILANSDMVPKDYRGKPGNIMIAMQFGAELGIGVMAALQNIASINGKPSVYGDLALALCQRHPDYAGHEEDSDSNGGWCVMKRKGNADVRRTFSQAEAKTAKLWGKQGPWSEYPARMLLMRARTFAMRDQFADALKGLAILEEQRDVVEARQIEAPRAATTISAALPARNDNSETPTPAVDTDPGSFVVQAGKHKGMTVRELGDERTSWFAENSKDEKLKAACQAYLEKRIEAEAVASASAMQETEDAEFDDETGEVRA